MNQPLNNAQEHAEFARRMVVSLVVACQAAGQSPYATLEFIQWMYRLPRAQSRTRPGLSEAMIDAANRCLLDLQPGSATLQ